MTAASSRFSPTRYPEPRNDPQVTRLELILVGRARSTRWTGVDSGQY